MDPLVLTTDAFWHDPAPIIAGDRELAGHVLFETSGSSGTPKSVALSKSALLASAAAVNRHLQVSPNSRWGLALPAHHVGGFGVAARCYQSGAKLCIYQGKWNATRFRDWLHDQNVTHTSLVPAQVHDLVALNLPSPPSLIAIVVGGGRLESGLGRRARDLGWPVLASYGMTEAGSQIATQSLAELAQPYNPAPILLLPIWDARTTPDSRLEISGPALFSGYVIAGKYHPRESEWHLTEDRVELEGGYLTPLGRADTFVKILGELADTAAIERELMECCGRLGSNFAVIAFPHERSEHSLVPVFESSVEPATAIAAIEAYNSRCPGFRRLGAAVFVPRFPRSELGKIRRGELFELLQSGAR